MTDDVRPGRERRIRIGGLMRCCLATIEQAEQPTKPGDKMACRWCSDSMVVAEDGVWEWDRRAEVVKR